MSDNARIGLMLVYEGMMRNALLPIRAILSLLGSDASGDEQFVKYCEDHDRAAQAWADLAMCR